METIEVLHVIFDKLTLSSAINTVEQFIKGKKKHLIVTPNPEIVLKCQDNLEYRKIINSASLRVPDGVGIVWAGYMQFKIQNSKFKIIKGRFKSVSRILILTWFWTLFEILIRSCIFVFCYWFYRKRLKVALPERVTGTDLMLGICQKVHCQVFLLGAEEGVAEKAKNILEQRNCRANIVGTYSGNPDYGTASTIISLINKCKPNVLFVAFGAPVQEFWIHKHLKKMPSVKVAIGVGGSFDSISGKIPRAPLLFQKLGLEWAWRFYNEPKRYKRMYNALIVFPVRVIKSIINNY